MRRTSVPHGARRRTDRDLVPILALFWLVSAVRVVGAVVQHETFGAEATLALIAVVLVPCVVFAGGRRKAH